MTGKSDKDRIEELRSEIREHDRRYYVEGKPKISDEAYDQLMKELQDLEKKHPDQITPDSPTQRVGGEPLSEFKTIRHTIPMLSLDNTYSAEDLRNFDERVRKGLGRKYSYVVEPKIDGVAASLRYEKGVLVLGASRGDGERGDDITENIKTVRDIPLRLHKEMDLDVRAEIYMRRSVFERLNKERKKKNEEPFANPRNAAAGTLRQLDPKVAASRSLSAFVHTLAEIKGKKFEHHSDALAYLKDLGLPMIPKWKKCGDIDEVIKTAEEWKEGREKLDYETDGLTVKVDNYDQRNELGRTGKSPRWAMAYKYAEPEAETTIEEIEVSVGRTGTLTPVAVFDPVFLSGTKVSRASLHNQDEIERLDVQVGDRVAVKKGGEIIPQVVAVRDKSSRKEKGFFKLSSKCPVCHSKVLREEGEARTYCPNPHCPAVVRSRIEHFASREGMDIDGLGSEMIDWFLKNEIIHQIPDLYFLIEDPEKIKAVTQIERMGKKSVENLLRSIEISRRRPLHRLIYAIGIPGVGARTAEDLAGAFGSMGKLRKAGAETLVNLSGIGEKMARNIAAYLDHDRVKEEIDHLKKAGIDPKEETFLSEEGQGESEKPLEGKKVVVTGSLPDLDRRAAETLVKRLGGNPTSSVSKKTDLVVVGENPGSKFDKAKELHIQTLTGEAFVKKYGHARPQRAEETVDEKAINERIKKAMASIS